MNTKNMTQEQISALADGELADAHVDIVLAALRQQESRDTWNLYHYLGDALRSDELATTVLSSDFEKRMAARLEAEPAIVAPTIQTGGGGQRTPYHGSAGNRRTLRRFAMPGVAAAAVATLAFFTGPQMMVAMKGEPMSAPAQVVAAVSQNAVTGASAGTQVAVIGVAGQDGVVLRDPHIDEYLLAHQRFSPSVYSTAQYARSATFATDTDK